MDLLQNGELKPTEAKFITLLAEHIQNFQRTIIISRRRRQQALRSRKAKLRTFCIQNLFELEARIFDMLSIIGVHEMWNKKEEKKGDELLLSVESHRKQLSTDIKGKVKLTKTPRDTLRFYEDIVCSYNAEKWLETFRMSKHTFQLLCAQLRDAMQPNGINAPLKNLISLETRCALALYAFATGADYRVIAALFRISRTSVCKFMKRFSEAFLEKLGPYLLAMPKNEEEYREVRESFQSISKIPPLCVGLLGVCEIHVSPHMNEVENYANSAGATTLIVEALIDDKMLFRKVDLETKRPTMLINAPNEITKLGVRQINERFLPCFVIAPTNYHSLCPWLIQRYVAPQTTQQQKFNNTIDGLQIIKKEAFRRLFARWKILQHKGDLEPRTMILIARTCCALHNLLEEYENNYNDEWATDVDLSRFDAPNSCINEISTLEADVPTNLMQESSQLRDFLAQMIS